MTGGAGQGGTIATGFYWSFDKQAGFDFGRYSTVGTGAYAGAGGSTGLEFALSGNPRGTDLGGWATTVGGSATLGFYSPGAEVNLSLQGAKPSLSISPFSIGTPIPTGVGGEGHLLATYTKIETGRENTRVIPQGRTSAPTDATSTRMPLKLSAKNE